MAASRDSLHVIALVSGGKDSFFSLVHCMANEHRVVALANLYHRAHADESEDLNSFMYQTAGQGIVPLYSEATGLPLYRQEIQGSALNKSKDYQAIPSGSSPQDSGDRNEDETESLIPLLRRVMSAHPAANAICSGAILSTYQRTRLESVAGRLGLISLSYLWQYPSLPPPSQGGLLDDMAAVGFDVRIVKVASGGLGEDLLWRNLMDNAVRRKVQKGVGRFGGSLLGEGGEYETLVIGGSAPLWRGQIEAKFDERWIKKGGGGNAWIRFPETSGEVILKRPEEIANDGWKERVKVPELWDMEFDKLLGTILSLSSRDTNESRIHQSVDSNRPWKATMAVIRSPPTFTLYNLTAPQSGSLASEQMSAINWQLLRLLREQNIPDTDNIIFTTILLRTMADFTSVNNVYGQLFAQPNPPARVTVACGNGLPFGVLVMASFVIHFKKEPREGLHVQSRSYWAPANIGPYSQAISIPMQLPNLEPRLVYISGQIPLVPATMEVLEADQDIANGTVESDMELFTKQVCLGLQHLWRIGRAMNVSWWTGAVAFMVGSDNVHAKALAAWKVWEGIHQVQLWKSKDKDNHENGLDDLDLWDKKYGGLGSFATDEGKGHRLPDFERSSSQASCHVPQFFAVQVDGLPRGCEIEWQSSGIAYSDPSTPTAQRPSSYVSLFSNADLSDHDFRATLKETIDNSKQSGRLNATVYTPRPDLVGALDVLVIPCKAVWGPTGTTLAAGIVVHSTVSMTQVCTR